MQKAFSITKIISVFWTGLVALLNSFPAIAATESANSFNRFATHINGESLIYFVLLVFIGYLFFRKPLP